MLYPEKSNYLKEDYESSPAMIHNKWNHSALEQNYHLSNTLFVPLLLIQKD